MGLDLEKVKALAARLQGEVLFNEPLSKHTYYRIGGPAAALVFPKSLEDLQVLQEHFQAAQDPYFLLGQGSNLLVADEGFDGIVIRMSKFDASIEPKATGQVRTGASVVVSSFLRKCGQEGWGGLEFLTGIPGSMGGVIYMNGGTHLGEAKDALVEVELLGWSKGYRAVRGSELKFRYRANEFIQPDEVVLSATWKYQLEDPAQVKTRIDEVLVRRKSTQPLEYPSCGSVFKNPKETGLQAWQVVERLGLRGHRIGQAQISEKHPNWIVNLGGAKAADVKALIELVKARAQTELKVELHEEVRYLSNQTWRDRYVPT
jgi:UDP-N-acetylmuramate dehydrogenase